jgi:hypothetical protein
MANQPVKIGVKKSAQAGKKIGSLRQDRRRSTAFEPKEADIARAGRKGQSAKKGARHRPSRKVAVKGLEEEKRARIKREMHDRSRISTREGA